MNPVLHARTPERWLIVGPGRAWCKHTQDALSQRASSLPSPSFLDWRLRHGLIRVLDAGDLDAVLTQALTLENEQGARRNVTRIWAAMNEAQWYAATKNCDALRAPEARGLNVSLLGTDAQEADTNLHGLMRSADAPDALPRLTWLMNERPVPVPRSWLALAPLPELDEAKNTAMADDGYRCYAAWADDLLASHDPEELRELWGPYPDDAVEGESDQGAHIIQMDEYRKPEGTPDSPQSLVASRREGQGRLAAADASPSDRTELAFEWELPAAVSRGASNMQAFVRPLSGPYDKPGIAFVALWTNARKLPDNPDEICLVVTLSKRKPVLLKGRPDARATKGSVYSLRFDWPQERWPADLLEEKSIHLKRWLKDALGKARVSMQ
jgi:hypothetical protein